MISRRTILGTFAAAPLAACARTTMETAYPPVGAIERLDPRLDAVVEASTPIEVLATGYSWAEGPTWVPSGGYLLFSDPPNNVVHRWTPGVGAAPFLSPSGLVGPIPTGVREAGANGLRIDDRGQLVFADSGTRVIARMDLATREKTVLAATYQGKRFNSPNDLVLSRTGAVYFSDPPYGLSEADASPLREVPVNGLYRIAPNGDVALLDGSHKRPNGVALSPDERTLYLALSDEAQPQVLAYRGRDCSTTCNRNSRKVARACPTESRSTARAAFIAPAPAACMSARPRANCSASLPPERRWPTARSAAATDACCSSPRTTRLRGFG